MIARRSSPVFAFIVQPAGTPASSMTRIIRQIPTRWPYSRQE